MGDPPGNWLHDFLKSSQERQAKNVKPGRPGTPDR
jgi:hypothetical protein